jgi:hypothetical protein
MTWLSVGSAFTSKNPARTSIPETLLSSRRQCPAVITIRGAAKRNEENSHHYLCGCKEELRNSHLYLLAAKSKKENSHHYPWGCKEEQKTVITICVAARRTKKQSSLSVGCKEERR